MALRRTTALPGALRPPSLQLRATTPCNTAAFTPLATRFISSLPLATWALSASRWIFANPPTTAQHGAAQSESRNPDRKFAAPTSSLEATPFTSLAASPTPTGTEQACSTSVPPMAERTGIRECVSVPKQMPAREWLWTGPMFTSLLAQKFSPTPLAEGLLTCAPRTTVGLGASPSSSAKTPPKAMSRPVSRLPPPMAALSQCGSGSAPQQVAPCQPPAWDITAQPIQAPLGKACSSCRETKSSARTQTSSAIITRYG